MTSRMPAKQESIQGQSAVQRVNSEKFLEMCQAMAQLATYEDEEAQFNGDDLIGILSAETEEEMWAAVDSGGGYSARALEGTELRILEFSAKFSRRDFETAFQWNGKRMYCTIKATRISDARGDNRDIVLPGVGEEFTFNTSARLVGAPLFWLFSHAALPRNITITATALGDGTAILKAKPLSERVYTA